MKKILLFLIFAVLCQGAFLFSEPHVVEFPGTELNYVRFQIEKIYAYRMGYVVLYRTGNRIAQTLIPREWFHTQGGPGDLIFLGPGSEWPSMVVFHNNGEFYRVRLRLRRNTLHPTWGVIPMHLNLSRYFEGLEELHLEFR